MGPWFYFAFAYNGVSSNLFNFENGLQIGVHTVSGNISVSGNNPGLGGCSGGETLANAVVDEVRVEQVCRSANWIWASYMTAAANSTFETMSMTREYASDQ